MSNLPKTIKRGRITYVLYADKVVVGLGMGQWVSYNQYDNWNRQGIGLFRDKILQSKEDEYATASDQITLAVECGITGTGTQKPKEIE